jgi:putative DNA primase/helicase
VTGDDDQIDRIYRTSGRYRDKWDSRRGGSTYGANTIVAARLSVLQDNTPKQAVPVGLDGFEYNDWGNAMRLLQAHQDQLRWVEEWNCWMVFDDGRWVRDMRNARVENMAGQIAEPLLEHIGPMRHDPQRMKVFMAWYNQTRNGFGMAATVKVARTMPAARTSFSELDAHPWLLNTKGRTIDLSNGYARDPDPKDMLTRCCGVYFDPKAQHDQWSRFLERVIPDPEVRLYVQCLAGLSLLGEPQELLPILWGDGANGKTTLTEVMAMVLGDYAVKVSHDLLLVQKQQVHPTAKADLFGVRFAHSGELGGADRINEALVKELTGGDTIKARRMYEDFWEFKPSHLMWLHSNYRPRVTGTDTGIWRRVKLIPFEVQIPKDERVDGLKWRLFHDEGSGILNWMLAGLAFYKNNGDRLPEPPAVVDATSEYRAEADTVGQFFESSGLQFGPDLWCKASAIDMAHAMWFGSSTVRSTPEVHSKMVKAELRKRGCEPKQKRVDGRPVQVWDGCGFPDPSLPLG